ncbi:WD40 protein DMR-N9 [Ceraceosorus bombacis]|uniref:WD40 protein DMR-N9 n=1 Tax=Ceraceosorus bombacis TaxID=401625 RepID=A0A0P1BII7_9BASI|nr:WD40 protein DMR-N9 [Ceraceosorus bombacis]
MAANLSSTAAGASASQSSVVSPLPSPEGLYQCTATTISPVILAPSLSLTPGSIPPPPPAARLSIVSVRHPRRGSAGTDDASAALVASTGSLGAAALTASSSGSQSGGSESALGVGTSASKGAKDNSKRPKNNIKQTSSSFVQRLTQHPELTKILAARVEGDSFAFLNSGKSFLWLADLHSKTKEPLARMAFASPVTAHDVNQVTRSSDRLDIVLGFASGDLLWLDPVSSRYTRINKGGIMVSSRVTQVRWLPGSENLFLSSHADGTMMICDRYREDAPTGSWTPASVWSHVPSSETDSTVLAHDDEHAPADSEPLEVLDIDGLIAHREQRQLPHLRAWDSRRCLLVTRPGENAMSAEIASSAGNQGKKSQQIWATRNPISHWRVCESKINDFAFSPDFPHCAIVSEDGMLRLVDFQDERLEFSFNSYFGAINCATWSPDGRFLLTGSCDDLVTIWAPREGRIIARCPGHASFVRAIAFDPWRWRIDDRTYRFASVGEDNRLILWDFSSAALQRPKHSASGGGPSHGVAAKRPALGSTVSLGLDGRRQSFSARRASMGLDRGFHSGPGIGAETDPDLAPCFEAPPRGAVAELQPISVSTLSPQAEPHGETAPAPGQTSITATSATQNATGGKTDLLCGVRFNLTGIVVLRRSGATHTFERPAPPPTFAGPAAGANNHAPPRSSSAIRRPITFPWRSETSEAAA